MSTNLGPVWPPIMDRTPPRMSPEDLEIYRAWWPRHAEKANRVWYDVGLGEGSAKALPANTPTNYADGWTRNTQKRADMLADMGKVLWLIELRHAATSNAVGRLLQYLLLWNLDPIIKLPVRLVLVSNHYDHDLELLCLQSKITYEWV